MQATSPSIFALATQWAERHDAILQRTPPALREAMDGATAPDGIRWGVGQWRADDRAVPRPGLPPKAHRAAGRRQRRSRQASAPRRIDHRQCIGDRRGPDGRTRRGDSSLAQEAPASAKA
jgi:hypothetical protein